MFSIMRRRFTYANVILTLALVFAMTGGAYAAKHYLITSTKQISPKVVAALQGKAGKTGPAGPAGLAGPAGPMGPSGPGGATGASGKNGLNGEKGERGATGPAGTTGAAGATGSQGVKGEPWTPNNVLPSNATEKGAWSASGMPVKYFSSEVVFGSISFTIPLATAPAVHVIEELGHETTECPGGVTKPEALPGNLCIFLNFKENVSGILSSDPGGGGLEEAGITGSVLFVIAEKAGEGVLAKGTWAVTAS